VKTRFAETADRPRVECAEECLGDAGMTIGRGGLTHGVEAPARSLHSVRVMLRPPVETASPM
jgi:hypothetical protein